ncbi:lysostaphin resistance A-like protein [Blastomonas sp.]|uniref:CPBP family intramembrane glutamic endopeptidase n=1 Tax=Blastomonas sp. TaxID=1909299 RepID=UPI0035946B4F
MQHFPAKPQQSGVWKIRGSALLSALLALPVGGAWIIASGAYVEFPIVWSIAYGIGLVALFLLVHGLYAYRRGARTARYMQVPSGRAFVYATIATALLLGCAVLSLLASGPSDATDAPTDHDRYALPVLAILLFPVVEEFAFRGWFQGNMERVVGPEIALLLAAIAFAAVHASGNPTQHFISGLVYGAAFLLSRNIWLPIFMHALYNFGVVLLDTSSAAIEWAETIRNAPPAWIEPVSGTAQAAIALVIVGLLVQLRRTQSGQTAD